MSSISKLASVAAQREKQAFNPAMLMGGGIGAGYGMGSAPEGESLSNVTHHGLRGLGAGAGATAGAGLGAMLAQRLAGADSKGVANKPSNLGMLVALLAGGAGGGYLGNRLTKKLLGDSPGERENEQEEQLQNYLRKVSSDEYMEKNAFKGFGYLDDILRGGAKGLKWLGTTGAPKAVAKTKDFFKGPRGPVGEAIMGAKNYKPGPLPKLRSIASRVPGAGRGKPQTTNALIGELARRSGRGAQNLGTRARHFLHQPGQGALRTLGKGGLLAGGGLAAKDLATLPFGGWASKDDKGGMRRGGLDYQRQAINPANVGAASAAINALFSPLKSMASLPLGDADASPVGYKDKYLGQSGGGVRRYQRTPYAVGPLAQRKQRELAEAQKAYDALRSGKKSELEKARSDYAGGAYPELEGYDDLDPRGRRGMQRSLAQARINKLKAELGSGNYGGTTGWFTRERPSASALGKTIGEREDYLRGLGLLGGGDSGSGLWQSEAASSGGQSRARVLRELGY